jgi:hypothetical protein
MKSTDRVSRARLGAVVLILSGVCFILFPVIRPFFDELSLEGAAQFASARWVVAHALGMGAFLCLSLGFLGVYLLLRPTPLERRTFFALILSWIGSGLTLPFFGAEAFGVQVIGRTAFTQNSTGLIPLVNLIRFGPGLIFIGAGLLLIAVAGIVLATAVWKSEILPRWSAVPLAVGLVVYMPQLQGAPLFRPIRITVGLLIAAGCAWLAGGMFRAAGEIQSTGGVDSAI